MTKSAHKKTTFNRAVNFVVWLIGVLFLLFCARVIIVVTTIWGFLGVFMMWSIFCIHQL